MPFLMPIQQLSYIHQSQINLDMLIISYLRKELTQLATFVLDGVFVFEHC